MKLKKPTTRQLSVGGFLAAALILAGFLMPPGHHAQTAEAPGHEMMTQTENHSLEEVHASGNQGAEETPGSEDHGGGWLEFPAFFALFGFVGCLLLIIVAKSLGALFLQQKEDIYD
ncbi:MAG: hypothetical protein KJ970_07920 [Candidatus Eisenbacteria bacterium]|uniref:Cobalt transporter n=1 Tax=Eiseniibacteriota bacterium TaxID=2212470 RepID=A0A948RTQ5_UNCEI|nr:hypothetical protein [Candidatus Eisenbacteria bacterium]MBU1947464.1 hypothetical protein [Candidatus Eisenbacteria bacterium]MBU2690843.1 hypothetical protein [Candidatus Eisenbacteria bacterium]